MMQVLVFKNALLAEYIEHPGRVFLEAKKDIAEGEEVFVLYGAAYWGIPEYPYSTTLEQSAMLPFYADADADVKNLIIEQNRKYLLENLPLKSPTKICAKKPRSKRKPKSVDMSSDDDDDVDVYTSEEEEPVVHYTCKQSGSLKLVFQKVKVQ